jgi:hypothetical protein
LAPTRGEASDPTVPTGAALDEDGEEPEEEDDEPDDEEVVWGQGETCADVEIEGNDPDDDDPELLEDGAGV